MKNSQRSPHALLVVYAVALSVAVVLWATSYKLEQYPEQGHAWKIMPPAKLLTEKERPPRAALEDAQRMEADSGRIPLIFAASVPISVLLKPPPRRMNAACLRPTGLLTARENPAHTRFGFRAPPSLLLA
jgi:hypothetical protein